MTTLDVKCLSPHAKLKANHDDFPQNKIMCNDLCRRNDSYAKICEPVRYGLYVSRSQCETSFYCVNSDVRVPKILDQCGPTLVNFFSIDQHGPTFLVALGSTQLITSKGVRCRTQTPKIGLLSREARKNFIQNRCPTPRGYASIGVGHLPMIHSQQKCQTC